MIESGGERWVGMFAIVQDGRRLSASRVTTAGTIKQRVDGRPDDVTTARRRY